MPRWIDVFFEELSPVSRKSTRGKCCYSALVDEHCDSIRKLNSRCVLLEHKIEEYDHRLRRYLDVEVGEGLRGELVKRKRKKKKGKKGGGHAKKAPK